MSNNSLFADRMKEARTRRNMSQAELSRVTGIAPATLSSYEKGKNPPIDKAASIAKSLCVSLDWLCGNDPEKNETGKLPFSDIIKALLLLLKIKGNFYSEGNSCDLGYVPEGETLGYIHLNSEAVCGFLYEFKKIKNILDDSSYPQYLKDGLLKTIIDKYSKFYLEQGKIKNTEDEKYNDFHEYRTPF